LALSAVLAVVAVVAFATDRVGAAFATTPAAIFLTWVFVRAVPATAVPKEPRTSATVATVTRKGSDLLRRAMRCLSKT